MRGKGFVGTVTPSALSAVECIRIVDLIAKAAICEN